MDTQLSEEEVNIFQGQLLVSGPYVNEIGP